MDELERLRARNAELEAALAKGAPNLVTRTEPPTFKRSDLQDAAFFAAHRKDILDAASHGRIVDDLPARDLGSAIANHYGNQPTPARDRARRQAIADRFQVDPALESNIEARARIGAEAYDAEMARVGAGQKLEMALYQRDRGIAVEFGTFVPASTPKEGSR
jgi:hypothetical protein